MRTLRSFFARIRGTLWRGDSERELHDELAAHVQLHVEDNLRQGLSLEEARRRALLRLGGLEQTKEAVREQRSLPFLETLFHDFRFASRILHKSPAFTFVAVLTLALGIGATTAIFSVIYGVLIRPMAVPEAQQVIQVVLKYRGAVSQDAFTYPEFRFLQKNSPWSAATAAFTHVGFNLNSSGSAERISALHVSSDYFRVLGAAPSLGRAFSAEEDRDPGARVVLLSHHLWAQRFHSNQSIIGSIIQLNGNPYTVIGVMPPVSSDVELDWVPPAFGDLQRVDLWTTLAPVADSVGSGENLAVVARMQPNVGIAQTAGRLESLNPSFRHDFLEGEGTAQSLGLSSVQQIMASGINTYLWILLAAVALVLIIACANISNLLLAQGAARSREVAIRAALGATRARLIMQFLSESLLLSAMGCVFGFSIAKLALVGLLRIAPIQLPRVSEIHVDSGAFLFALALTFLTGAFSAMVPAFYSAKTDVQAAVKESAAQSSSTRRAGRFRGILVTSEIALSIILLIGASLLMQTFVNLLRVDPGFDPKGVLSAEFWITGSRYHSTAELTAFYDNLNTRLRQLPGVQQVTIASLGQPLERGGNMGLTVNGAQGGSMNVRVVTPDYFRTLRAAIRRGRDFASSDAATSQPVAIVNEAFVRRYVKEGDPLASFVQGQNKSATLFRIVGVAADVKSYVDLPEDPCVFLLASQAPFGLILGFDVWFPTHILIRASGDPVLLTNSVRSALQQVDAAIPAGRIVTMDQVLARSLAAQRFIMVVVTVFAVLALILAAVGVYGVISFTVSQRMREFGIRMALGAEPGSVLLLILRYTAGFSLLGCCIGIAGAVILQRAIESVLFGVHSADPRAILFAAAVLVTVILLACYFPARRASRVDPMISLRYE